MRFKILHKGQKTIKIINTKIKNITFFSTFNAFSNDALFCIHVIEYKLELKAYSIAKQYNHITDYKASIKTFDNFIADFPGSTLREKALYYRFDSAYRLAINSVEYKKKQRLEDAITYYNAFKRLYSGSEFIADADKMNEDLKEQLQKYSTNI